MVTPEEQAFDAPITQAIIPAHDGLLGVLTDRAPLLVKLGVGPLRLDLPDGKQRFFLIDGGVAQVKDNRLTILTTQAQAAENIDMDLALAEYQQALAQHPADEAAAQQRQHLIALAKAKQELARK
jgi:F-type H+-transporting ATPase subunit epsilon